MSHIQGPPPNITSVESMNMALRVNWEILTVYENSSDATLFIIDTVNNSMSSILLGKEEINAETYLVNNLVNGRLYSVFFSLLLPDGNTRNSNTVSSTPSNVPDAPTITNYSLQSGFQSIAVNVTPGSNGGSNITSMVFRIYDEESQVCSTQALALNANGTSYTLTGFVQNHDYIICVQALNIAGYGESSKSIGFKNSDAPPTPVLGVIQSGKDGKVTLPISGSNNVSNPITSFNVSYKLSSESLWTQISFPKQLSTASYSTTLELSGLNNASVGYSFKVSAVNSVGEGSQDSNIQNATPAVQKAFSDLDVTFESNNKIILDWENEEHSWNTSGRVTATFFANGVQIGSAVEQANSSNPTRATLTLATGNVLQVGVVYSVVLTGHVLVPQSIVPAFWVEPALENVYRWSAVQNSVSAAYATVPGKVSNVDYSSDISDNTEMGQIQFNWKASDSNGSPITAYICQLYTIANGSRNPLGESQSVSTTNILFDGLDHTLYYAIGIKAQNSEGEGVETYYPESAEFGILLTGNVDPVQNLVGSQVNYDGAEFTGKLSWDYSGPGENYTNTVFNIYSVVNGIKTLVSSQPYVNNVTEYNVSVNLGAVTGASKNFCVQVVAKDNLLNPSTSVAVYVAITTGVAPLVYDIAVGESSPYTLSFTVKNPSPGNMIAGSISSLVLPDPLSDIGNVYPFQNNYDVSLVDSAPNKTYTYRVNLGYPPLVNGSTPFLKVNATNAYSNASVVKGWPRP